MRKTKRILFLLAFVSVVVAIMVVCTSAYVNLSPLGTKILDSHSNVVASMGSASNEAFSVLSEAITADGFSIRLNDSNAETKGPALRSEFTLNTDKVNSAKESGYTLSDYGVIVFAETTINDNQYNGNVDAVMDAAWSESDSRVVVRSAKEGPFVNESVIQKDPNANRVFAVALTEIAEEHYTSPVCTYAYAVWTNGVETYYSYVTYTSERTEKTTHSLYDATIYAFRNGIVNSQNFNTGVDLWDILCVGAFSIEAGEEKKFAEGMNPTVEYKFDENNKFTYLDLPLHAWIIYKNAGGNINWDSGGHSLEDDNQSTNIVWSLLCDGDDLIAVYRKDPDSAGDAVLPRIIDRKNCAATAPFSPYYFTPGTGYGTFKGIVEADTMVNGQESTNGLYRKASIYSPIVSDANAEKITTLVIDYGVKAFDQYSLENNTVSSLTSIIYPEGVSAGGYVLARNSCVENVICAPVSSHILPEETREEAFGNIFDLSGLESMSLMYAFSETTKAENIILPVNNTTTTRTAYTFNKCEKLKRVWTLGEDIPAAGTINLTGATTLKSFCQSAFDGVPSSTIIMPASFVGVGYYSMTLSQPDPGSRVFGVDKEHNIVLANTKGLISEFIQWNEGGLIGYYDKLHTIDASDADYDNVDLIKVTCYVGGVEMTKTIAEWKYSFGSEAREEFYKENNLTIYPEFSERVKRDYMYNVSVTQGDKTSSIPVYNHCQDSPHWIRDIAGNDKYRRFSMFAFSGEQVRVDIKVGCDFESYTVMPSAKGLESEFKDGVISVYLDKPEYFVIRLDNDNNSLLSILVDYPEYPLDIPSKNDPDVIWISGVQEAEKGVTELSENNQTLYVEPGAVFFSRVKITGENCKVLGRGAIVDPYENFYKFNPTGQSETKGTMMIGMLGKNALFDGPVLLDAHCYNFHVRNGGTVRNGKALSVMITSDGLQVTEGSAERCYVYVGDNGTVFQRTTSYKDITIGTTCGAIFPQNEITSAVLEDIYVFRADEGVINNYYNSDGTSSPERTVNVTINGLYADDCASLPYLFKGKNMGRLEKIFNLTNVTVCPTTGVVGAYAQNKTNALILFDTVEGALFTDNYTLNIKNLYVGGQLMNSSNNFMVVTSGTGAVNYINVSSDSEKILTSKRYDVSYANKLNVFIGALQVFTDSPVIEEGGKIYLPAEEIKTLLRVKGNVTTTEKNGTAYVEVNDLVASGFATGAEKKGNAIVLTPMAKRGDLLLADSGDIPYFTEATAYRVDMTARVENGETIYSLFNITAAGAGIKRDLTDEIKMYGNGKYVLKFELNGTGKARIKTYLDTIETTTNPQSQTVQLNGIWKTVSVEIDINTDLNGIKCFSFIVGADDTGLAAFDIKNITFEKIG